MDASLRFLVRRPPRTGWILFFLALSAVLVLPTMLMYSSLELASGPMVVAVAAGLLLGLAGFRRFRLLLLIPALLLPFWLLELLPPLRIVAADLRSVLRAADARPPLLLPAALDAAFAGADAALRAAWQGDAGALSWAIAHLAAVLGYLVSLILGIALRRGLRMLAWTLPLLMALVAVGITTRSGTFHIMVGVFLTLLVSLVGGFASRELTWEREGVGFSDLLRADVGVFGSALLTATIILGLLTPAAPRNLLTTWLWTDVELPAGLARLDTDQPGAGRAGGGSARIGGMRPGVDLELGRSLEEGESEDIALAVQVADVDQSELPYWRGRIFDVYNGRGWNTGQIRPVTNQALVLDEVPEGMIRQSVTDLRSGRRLRYGLPDIVAIDQASTVEQSESGYSVSWIGNENEYTVYSRPPEPLDVSGPEVVEAQRTLASYLIVPESIPDRVIELARELTVDANSQTERATALEAYLRGLKYSYQVEPLKPGGDAVDQFLFTMQSGYCTYYASAMAVMARSIGIPSRVAVGYATGEFDPQRGAFVVREADAHAWPELYIDGQGWTRWEPTPIRPIPARSTRAEQPRPLLVEPLPEAPVAGPLAWWPVFAVIGLLIALLFVGRLRRLARPLSPAGVHADLYRYGYRAGVRPAAGDSVEEYVGRLGNAVPRARNPLQRVAQLLTARLYRAAPLTPGEERSLVSSWYAARGILRRPPTAER